MASIEEKLQGLWNLQTIDKNLDQLQAVRGELPMEVADLEDELAGLQTRLDKFEQEIADFDSDIVCKQRENQPGTTA